MTWEKMSQDAVSVKKILLKIHPTSDCWLAVLITGNITVNHQKWCRALQTYPHTITESQNGWVGRELGRSTYPTSLFTQGYLHPVAQDFVQMPFAYLKAFWTLYNLSRPLLPVLGHPHSKKVLPYARTEHSRFQFVPVASCSWAPLKRGWLSLLWTIPSDIYIR